jgi:charged multivesicular body protein 2A
MAKDLVRIRKHEEKFANLTAQLRAISLQMTSMQSTQSISEAMKKVTRSMQKLNKQVNLPQLQAVMREFAKQSEQLDMKQEMIGDSIDDVMDDGEDEKESEMIVNQVLDEIGVTLGEGLVDVPGKKPQQEKEEVKVDEADKALEARFNNLGGQ